MKHVSPVVLLLGLLASYAIALPVEIADPGAEQARDGMPAGVDAWASALASVSSIPLLSERHPSED